MWLFVAGDDAWPPATDAILMALFVVAFAVSALGLAYLAYAAGKKHELAGSGGARPALLALGLTGLLVLALAVHQWSVGNIGAKSEGVLCAEFCASKRFMASSLPPRISGPATCTCLDAQGREALTVPIEDIRR